MNVLCLLLERLSHSQKNFNVYRYHRCAISLIYDDDRTRNGKNWNFLGIVSEHTDRLGNERPKSTISIEQALHVSCQPSPDSVKELTRHPVGYSSKSRPLQLG